MNFGSDVFDPTDDGSTLAIKITIILVLVTEIEDVFGVVKKKKIVLMLATEIGEVSGIEH